MFHDLKFACRQLLKNPGFTAVTLGSLALGIAATASVLVVVNVYLVRALPFPDAGRLYRVVYSPNGGPEPARMSALDWKSLSDVVEDADYSMLGRVHLLQEGALQERRGLLAAPGSLEALGVRPGIGRLFADEDYHPGGENVALIGDRLWRDEFGSDPNVVGRSLLGGLAGSTNPPQSIRIIGVLPPDFRHVREYAREPTELCLPMRQVTQSYMVRLREGVPAASAEKRISDLVRATTASLPPNWQGIALESIHEGYVRELRPVLWSVVAAAAFVLLIVILNVAVLALLRSLRRQKESAVRVALGASRKDLAKTMLAETGLQCVLALGGAIALTYFMLSLLAPEIETRLGKPIPGGLAALRIDPVVLLFVGGVTSVIAVTLAFVPWLGPWQHRLADALKSDARSGPDGRTTNRLRSSLLVVEIAVSMALLAGCGLMIRSVSNMLHTDFGYRPERVLRARIQLPPREYPEAQSFMRFYDRFTERLATYPDTSLALANFVPFFENPKEAVEVEGNAEGGGQASVLLASETCFETLGIELRKGRGITAADREGAEPVAIISESLAARLWPGGEPLGGRIRTVAANTATTTNVLWRTVVGVTRDVRQTYAQGEDNNDVYIPFAQQPVRFASLLIRTDRPAQFWEKAMRAAVAEIDPKVMVQMTDPLLDAFAKEQSGRRFLMAILTGFGLFAAFLATLGIYAVTAYAVQQRERELAIRVAVGATGGAVVALFLKSGSKLLIVGIGLGLLAAIAVGRLLGSQLYGVEPFDLPTVLGSGLFMTIAGLLATWVPVRRQAFCDPMTVLKGN